MWPEQEEVVRAFFANDKLIVLKARQLGLSWLFVALQLWTLDFQPGSATLIFSLSDREAVALFRDRMKEMHRRLPEWMRSETGDLDNDHAWRLVNGSTARCFPSSAGDSYTATCVLVDEADLIPDLNRLLLSVEPTMSAGGKLVLISKADKRRPGSDFKKIYRAAAQGRNDFRPVFLPWHVRPERRTGDWYERQRRDSIENTGSLDNVKENYPATAEEALEPRTLDKRIPGDWLTAVYVPTRPASPDGAPSIPGLRIYTPPVQGRTYVIGADPAEGNPTSDDSALCVVDAETWHQVACLAGKFEPSTLAAHIEAVSIYYHKAAALVERNNHGHAVLLWLKDNTHVKRLKGDDGKAGWLSSSKGKTVMYDLVAEATKNGELAIVDEETYLQLASIDGSSLRAPSGEHDDRADALALAIVAANRRPSFGVRSLT